MVPARTSGVRALIAAANIWPAAQPAITAWSICALPRYRPTASWKTADAAFGFDRNGTFDAPVKTPALRTFGSTDTADDVLIDDAEYCGW